MSSSYLPKCGIRTVNTHPRIPDEERGLNTEVSVVFGAKAVAKHRFASSPNLVNSLLHQLFLLGKGLSSLVFPCLR